MKREIEEIAATVLRQAKPDASPKALMSAVRKAHPKASKKDVVRAALYAVLTNSDDDPVRASRIHNFALNERKDTGPADVN